MFQENTVYHLIFISSLKSSPRFRAGVKDLEVMMQNVITSAFETITTVEGGVELLDIFMHLGGREVSLRCALCYCEIIYSLDIKFRVVLG